MMNFILHYNLSTASLFKLRDEMTFMYMNIKLSISSVTFMLSKQLILEFFLNFEKLYIIEFRINLLFLPKLTNLSLNSNQPENPLF
jgi:hypothetical protein